jgi:hypothetical protein
LCDDLPMRKTVKKMCGERFGSGLLLYSSSYVGRARLEDRQQYEVQPNAKLVANLLTRLNSEDHQKQTIKSCNWPCN